MSSPFLTHSSLSQPTAGGGVSSTDEDWLFIAPYADTPMLAPGGSGRTITLSFQHAQATQVVAALNAQMGRTGVDFRGVPIFRGHPDVDPARWPDDRRFGDVIALQDRDTGFYGQVRLNDLGLKNREQGYYIYAAPAWKYDLLQALQSGVAQPTELRSIGLSNTPASSDARPWTSSTVFNIQHLNNPELITAERRQCAFNAHIDHLLKPASQGGGDCKTLDDAITALRTTAQGSALLLAMNHAS